MSNAYESFLMESQHKHAAKKQSKEMDTYEQQHTGQSDAADLLPEEKPQFKFQPLDPIILYACHKCKARYVTRFRKGWRTLDEIRGLEPVFSPQVLFCKPCALFNIEHFLKIDEMN